MPNILFMGLVLCLSFWACGDTKNNSFEIYNTTWRTVTPPNIQLKFSETAVEVTYEAKKYPSIAYLYEARRLQGNFHIKQFEYATGSVNDETWLFRVSEDGATLALKLFLQADKSFKTVFLVREPETSEDAPKGMR
ncbi:MAG: hypothetical protein AAF975_01965 [Spirochaetota bacterium]